MNNFHTLWAKIKRIYLYNLIYLSCKPSPKRGKSGIPTIFKPKNKNFAQRDDMLTFIDISPTLLKPNQNFYPGLWKEDNLV